MRVLKMLIVVGIVGAIAAGPALAQTPPSTPPAAPPPQTTPPAKPGPPRHRRRGGGGAAAVSGGRQDRLHRHPGRRLELIDGKAATGKLQELEKKKVGEIQAKTKQLEDAKTKQQTSSTIMNDAPRLSLEKEVDKLTREVQFLQQEAQSDRHALPGRAAGRVPAQAEPVLERSARKRACTCWSTSRTPAPIWVDTGLDLTQEVIKRLDAASKTAPKK